MDNPARLPRVSIGLPVYNGERYLAEAVDSLLAQTYPDLELIISDNGSTDRTAEMCARYAASDSRVRYSRLETNIGGYRNHNRVVSLARGEYFTWAAHDDVRSPGHLASTVEALDAHPDAVLCYTAEQVIDQNGDPLPARVREAVAGQDRPARRWQDIVLGDWVYEPHYGVIRTGTLRGTGLLRQHADADRVLLAELSLRGRFLRIDLPLFRRREHSGDSVRQFRSREERVAWYAPERPVPPPHNLSMLCGFVAALGRARIPWADRLECRRILLLWALRYHYGLREELGLTRSQLRDGIARLVSRRGKSPGP